MCVTPQEEAYSSDAQRTQEAKESGREGSIDIPRHARELAMRRAVAETSKRLDDREDVGSEGSGFEGEDELADEDRIPPLSQQLVAASQLFNITFYYSIIIPTIREYCITLNAGECARSQSPSRTHAPTHEHKCLPTLPIGFAPLTIVSLCVLPCGWHAMQGTDSQGLLWALRRSARRWSRRCIGSCFGHPLQVRVRAIASDRSFHSLTH